MRTPFFSRPFAFVVAVALAGALGPTRLEAQSGKWVATISQLGAAGGGADLTIESRNDKQSRAKIVFRNVKRDMRLAWDIVEGNCREDGKPIAPQATFTVVQTQMDGGGQVTANIPKLESGKKYYVRVFDNGTAASDANAFGCANISEKP
jgi:hypothetical protein